MKNLTITNPSEIKLSKKLSYLLELMTKLDLDPSKPVPGPYLFDESTQSWRQPFDIYYTIKGNRLSINFISAYDPKIQELINRAQKKLYPNPYPKSISYLIELLDKLEMSPTEPIFLEKQKSTTGRWLQPIQINYIWKKQEKKLIIPDIWDNDFIQNLIKTTQRQLSLTDHSNFNLNSKTRKIYTLMTQLGLNPQQPKPLTKIYDEELKRYIQPITIDYREDDLDKTLMIEDMNDLNELDEIIEMFDYKESTNIDINFFE